MDDMILSRDFNVENVRLLYDPQDILVEADKERMTQVFSNLLSNAIQITKLQYNHHISGKRWPTHSSV